MKRYLYLLFVLPVIAGCIRPNMAVYSSIYLYNYSERGIQSYLKIDHPDVGSSYPDTLVPHTPRFLSMIAKKNSWIEVCGYKGDWKTVFETWTSSDTLSVFIFDSRIVDTLSWDTIRDNRLFLLRMDLSISDIYNHREKGLSFPPDERMKDIHMYPPYQEIIELYGNN